jgi:hypothetical protein
MSGIPKVHDELARLVDCARVSGPVHVHVGEVAGRCGVTPDVVEAELLGRYRSAAITLTTWSNRAWREVNILEWQGTSFSFFHNRDDSNYVRMRARTK